MMYVVVIDDYRVIGVFDSLDKAHELVELLYNDIPYEIEKIELNSLECESEKIERGLGKAEY